MTTGTQTAQAFYHGSAGLFVRFSLDHVLEGEGKVKFGWDVYGTESRAHALAKNGGARNTPAKNGGARDGGAWDGGA